VSFSYLFLFHFIFIVLSFLFMSRWGLVWVFMGDQSLAMQTPLPSHLFTEFENQDNWSITRGFRDFDM